MAWRRPGDKPFSGPMMVSLLTHICVTWPQWVKFPIQCCLITLYVITQGESLGLRPTGPWSSVAKQQFCGKLFNYERWSLMTRWPIVTPYGINELGQHYLNYCLIINSLWPSDTIWWQRSMSTLAQAPSHYLNQCWQVIIKFLWHSSEGIITRRSADTNQ